MIEFNYDRIVHHISEEEPLELGTYLCDVITAYAQANAGNVTTPEAANEWFNEVGEVIKGIALRLVDDHNPMFAVKFLMCVEGVIGALNVLSNAVIFVVGGKPDGESNPTLH